MYPLLLMLIFLGNQQGLATSASSKRADGIELNPSLQHQPQFQFNSLFSQLPSEHNNFPFAWDSNFPLDTHQPSNHLRTSENNEQPIQHYSQNNQAKHPNREYATIDNDNFNNFQQFPHFPSVPFQPFNSPSFQRPSFPSLPFPHLNVPSYHPYALPTLPLHEKQNNPFLTKSENFGNSVNMQMNSMYPNVVDTKEPRAPHPIPPLSQAHSSQNMISSDAVEVSLYGGLYVQTNNAIIGVEPLCAHGSCWCPLLHYYASDSGRCLHQMFDCKTDQFKCADGQCIEGHLKCNRFMNCRDGTDELNCIYECKKSQFKCDDGQCIEGHLQCNGVMNCLNGTDEVNCTHSCSSGQFQCGDGTCIASNATRCNSVLDCLDGSDEAGCDCRTLGGCDPNATCTLPRGATAHVCKCNVGSVGDGEVCSSDQDLDGFPDVEMNCSDIHCRKDNCPTKPNSGQEDLDGNGIGDACDITAPVVTTTVLPPCTDTLNSSNCIPDSDRDGIENSVDNCPDVANRDQDNSDGDSLGDACDNCPNVTNAGQEDNDQDMVGDACDNDKDRDKDGIQDDIDNCPDVPNADQLNSDDDDKGNACDDDADNDGVFNWQDNCWLVHNPNQRINDPCLNDNDNDGLDNLRDNCPNNSMITKTDFRIFQKVDLDPVEESQLDPNWVIKNDGAEITQTENSDPGLFFGKDVFHGVDFEGTFYIDDTSDDDYAGFIFSYQSNARFYIMQWKNSPQTYWKTSPFTARGEPAITLKKVNSRRGPGPTLRNSLWHTGSVPSQTELLWTDPKNIGWEPHVAYRWQLLHRPQIGLIRLRVLKGATLVADSGNIFDDEIKGGRLGVFVFSQEDVIWSNLEYRCNEEVPQDVYDNLPADLQKKVDIDYSWNWW